MVVIRGAMWLQGTMGAERNSGVGPLSVTPAPVQSGPWFRQSGAMSLLLRRRTCGVGVVAEHVVVWASGLAAGH